MLRNRVLTALAMAGAVAATLLFAPPWLFGLLLGLVTCCGAYEWASFSGLEGALSRLLYSGGFALLAGVVFLFPQVQQPLIGLTSLLWVGIFGLVVAYPRGAFLCKNPLLAGVLGYLILLGAWAALIAIRQAEGGIGWLFWMFLLTTATDVGAFFAGRALGKRKLAARLSPAKTWEGVVGGAALAMLLCAGSLWLVLMPPIWWLLCLPGLLIFFAVVGDLFESLMKRSSDIKDSGDILPGHGGILDRIDSIVAVLPVLAWTLI